MQRSPISMTREVNLLKVKKERFELRCSIFRIIEGHCAYIWKSKGGMDKKYACSLGVVCNMR